MDLESILVETQVDVAIAFQRGLMIPEFEFPTGLSKLAAKCLIDGG